MTEPDKATDPRASDLTEVASAPSHSEGNHHSTPCGNEWCPEGLRCNHPYHTRYLQLALASVDHHTTTHNTVALGYAVARVALHQRAVDAHDRACEARERHMRERTNRANAKSKLGPWEFTLTYSPRQHGWSRDEAKDAMRTAIERLTRYYREEVEQFHATGELNAAGDPHVHAWYRLDGGRKITTKSFQRAYPIWNPKVKTGPRGHVGGHHEPVKRTADFAGYIEKDLQTAWLKVDITNVDSTEAHVPEAEGDDEAEASGTDASDSSPEPHDG